MPLKSTVDTLSEVMVVSDSGNKTVNCGIYDLENGSLLSEYKTGHSVRNGLCFIGEDYLISAIEKVPHLIVWTLSRNHVEDCKMATPGLVSCLAVSNCGSYCIAGIDSSIYVWEVPTGHLILSLQYHTQTLTCLRFSSDGSYFISGAKDGVVLVWLLTQVISYDTRHSVKPHYSWHGHSAEITDIFVGNLGIFARVVTASEDMTCKIYELNTGNLVVTVCIDDIINVVTMDHSEYFLMLGTNEGIINRINLFNVRDEEIMHINSREGNSFIGHTKAVTCLSVSSTSKYLLSGSKDGFCKLWDLYNFSCIRNIPFNGPITNAFITLMPPGLKNDMKYLPRQNVTAFTRCFEEETSDSHDVVRINSKELSVIHVGAPDEYFDSRLLNCSTETLESLTKSRVSHQELARINSQLYAYALCEIVNPKDTNSN